MELPPEHRQPLGENAAVRGDHTSPSENGGRRWVCTQGVLCCAVRLQVSPRPQLSGTREAQLPCGVRSRQAAGGGSSPGATRRACQLHEPAAWAPLPLPRTSFHCQSACGLPPSAGPPPGRCSRHTAPRTRTGCFRRRTGGQRTQAARENVERAFVSVGPLSDAGAQSEAARGRQSSGEPCSAAEESAYARGVWRIPHHQALSEAVPVVRVRLHHLIRVQRGRFGPGVLGSREEDGTACAEPGRQERARHTRTWETGDFV